MARITIRQACFETNSSSSHAIALLTDEQYDAVLAGKFVVLNDFSFTPDDGSGESYDLHAWEQYDLYWLNEMGFDSASLKDSIFDGDLIGLLDDCNMRYGFDHCRTPGGEAVMTVYVEDDK